MGFADETKKMKIIILLIILVIAMISMSMIFFNNRNKKIIKSSQKESYDYFPLYSLNNTVGVVNRKGKVLVSSEYTNIYIPNQSKDVFFCFNEDNYKILNSKGKEIFTDYYSVYPIIISDYLNEMEKNVLSYEENGKYGLIDYSGKKLTNAIFDEIESLTYKPGNILVRKDGLYGVLDSNGNTIIDTKYYSIKGDEYCSESDGYLKTGYIVSEKAKTGINYGYIDYNGKVLVEPKYETISRALEYENEDIYLVVMQNGKKGVIKNKKVIIKPKYQSINYYNISNIFIVNKNGKYGFFDNSGTIILEPEYTSYAVAGNYIAVKKDAQMFLYDLHGNLVNKNTYKSILETGNPSYFIAQYENGYYSIISKDIQIDDKYTNITYAFDNFFIFTNEEGLTGVLNVYTGIEIEPIYDYIIVLENSEALEARKGKEVDIYSGNLEKVLSMENAVVEKVENNYFAIYSKNDLNYINQKGKIVQNTQVYKNLIFSYKSEDGKWGFINDMGEIVVSPKYDIVTEINEYGFAGVCQDGKWGVIDETGNVIVVPSYELETYYFPQFIGKYLLEKNEDIHCTEIEK